MSCVDQNGSRGKQMSGILCWITLDLFSLENIYFAIFDYSSSNKYIR